MTSRNPRARWSRPAASTRASRATRLRRLTCAATSAGGSAARQAVTIKRDATAPTLSGAAATSGPNAAGWYNGDVTVHWTASDALSGLAGAAPGDADDHGRGRRPLRVRHGRRQGGQQDHEDGRRHQDRPHRPDHDGRHDRAAHERLVHGRRQRHADAVDNLSGVAKTYYKVDGGATQEYTDTFSHGLNGKHTIAFWSVDKAGNAEKATLDRGQDRPRQADDRGLPDARRERLRLEQQRRSGVVQLQRRRLRHRRLLAGVRRPRERGCRPEGHGHRDRRRRQHRVGHRRAASTSTRPSRASRSNGRIAQTAPTTTVHPRRRRCEASDTLSSLDGACSVERGTAPELDSHTFDRHGALTKRATRRV